MKTTGDPEAAWTERPTVEEAEAAFRILGNETRVAILLALWEAYEPYADDQSLSFSALHRAAGGGDAGNFNYHLKRLVGTFVRKTEGGYALREAGRKIVRAIVAGVGAEDRAFGPVEIDESCHFCGAAVAISYEDEWIHLVCTECEGFFGAVDGLPRGSLGGMELDPAGVADREPAEMFYAAYVKAMKGMQCAVEGVCIECAGEIERELQVCAEHDPEGVCTNCGRRFDAMVAFTCRVCKNHELAPPRTVVTHHPGVVAFYHERGVDFQYEVSDFAGLSPLKRLVGDHEQELLSTDPVRILVRVPYDGDVLRLTLDEDLIVIDEEVAVGDGDRPC